MKTFLNQLIDISAPNETKKEVKKIKSKIRNKTNIVSLDEVKNYLNVPIEDEDDDELLEMMIASAESYVSNYTGIDLDTIGEIPEIKIAILLLCVELYDNRGQQNLQFKRNLMIDSILSMHCINYL